MPHQAPKSLSNDQVYQLTAFILYRNQLIDKDEVVNSKNLSKIKMPYADKVISQWEMDR